MRSAGSGPPDGGRPGRSQAGWGHDVRTAHAPVVPCCRAHRSQRFEAPPEVLDRGGHPRSGGQVASFDHITVPDEDWQRWPGSEADAAACEVPLGHPRGVRAAGPKAPSTRRSVGSVHSRRRRWFGENVLPTFADRVLPFDLSAARILAVHRMLEHAPFDDSRVAAVAESAAMTIATRNTRHFEPPGVRCLSGAGAWAWSRRFLAEGPWKE